MSEAIMVRTILILLLAAAIPCFAFAQQSPPQSMWFKPNSVQPTPTPAQRPPAPTPVPGTYAAGPTPKLNPCAGISSDAVVATVNAHGGLHLSPNGPRFRATGAFDLQSTAVRTVHEDGSITVGAGVCTGYLTVTPEGGGGYTGMQFNVELQPDGTLWFWPIAQL